MKVTIYIKQLLCRHRWIWGTIAINSFTGGKLYFSRYKCRKCNKEEHGYIHE